MGKKNSRKTIILFIALCIVALLLLASCTQSIAEVKKEENIGETVRVKGTVEGTLKIGSISGFTIKDEAGESIRVSSKSLPEEGKSLTVSGTLMKDSLFGWYIKASE